MALLTPLKYIYGFVSELRSHMYKKKIFSQESVDRPVLVVGNLTMGGTGKTPFVDYLIKELTSEGIRAGVVSRGYKGNYQGVAKVDSLSRKAAEVFGDEPTLLHQKNPQAPIYLHAKRVRAAKKLIEDCPETQLIICDDGFQHQSLRRDFNIVLFDCTEKLENYQLLPEGRLREPLSALERADFVVFTKSNWANKENKNNLEKLVNEHFVLNDRNHAYADYETNFPTSGENKNILLISSIAKPDTFRRNVELNSKFVVKKHLVFSDHYGYSEKDAAKILVELQKQGCSHILTTEKDFVKLKEFDKICDKIMVAKISVRLTKGQRELKNEIFKIIS